MKGCVGGIRLDMWWVEDVHRGTCMGVAMRHMGYRGRCGGVAGMGVVCWPQRW